MKDIIGKIVFNSVRISLVAAIFILSSCRKVENPGLIIQDHDSNKMMSFLHEMMRRIDSLTLTNDPDNDFALIMKVHHDGAVQMCQNEIEEGSDTTLQLLAGEIIERHHQDLLALDSFLVAHPPVVNQSSFRQEAEKAMEIMSNNADLQIITGKTDHDFATLMIEHHQGAINLADLELYYGFSEPVRKLAVKIKSQQQSDIEQLQDWLLR